jgi:hypothetical protein
MTEIYATVTPALVEDAYEMKEFEPVSRESI